MSYPTAPVLDAYLQACLAAAEGREVEARSLFASLVDTSADRGLNALVANDLAVLAAIEGNARAAEAVLREALTIDPACMPARLNLDLLRADLLPPVEGALSSGLAPPPMIEPEPSDGPIRVAILSMLFNWPSTGGGTVHTAELAAALSAAGYEVRHLYARHPDWGVGNVDEPTPHPSQAVEFDEADWHADAIRDRFRRAVEEFDPDLVIITDSWNTKPLLAEAVRGYPYVLRLQAMEGLCPLNNVRLLPDPDDGCRQCHFHQLATPDECRRCVAGRDHLSGGLHRAERALAGFGTGAYHESLLRAFREAEAVLAVNPLAQAMIEPHARSVRVVTAGMDPARFPWPPPSQAARPDGRKSLLFAGLVDEWMKGFRVLHDACELLRARRRDFELVATGEPPGQVDEFTRFIGWQSQADLPAHLFACDLLVMPTIAQEALGRTAVEAMAAGRPVVASRIGGLPFTVADGATGLLAEPGNPADLARKIEALLDDDDLRRRMGLAGRRRFEGHYAWPVIVERHYRPLLRRRERGHRMGTATGTFTPRFPDTVDLARLLDDAGRLFDLPPEEVRRRWSDYRDFHDEMRHGLELGEAKTLCLEEAFVLSLALERARPATIVEVGTQHGRSTRRILDMARRLGLDCRVVCFDVADRVRHFRPGEEAELVIGDVTGRFRRDVLEALRPGLIFLDVHAHALLTEAVSEARAHGDGCILAIHDCGRGLCNPRMTIARDDPEVTSSTGVWERHVLAEAFGAAGPLDPGLDGLETPTHRLRIFDTRHGLGVLVPASARTRWAGAPAGAADDGLEPLTRVPKAFFSDADHPEPIALPPGQTALATSSSPQYTLYRLVRHARPRAVLEIGTQAGASAVACALAMRDNGTPPDVVCVDPFLPSGDNDGLATLGRWYEYVDGCGFLGSGVQLVVSGSRRALPMLGRRFDLILVDGSHEYADARHDIEAALGLLDPGGLAWIHDYVHYEPVRRAADEVIAEHGLPHAVNEVQRNARGDLCGWCLVRKP